MNALDDDSDVDAALVCETLLNSVINYLMEMDAGLTWPIDGDSCPENEDMAEIIDYLVAELLFDWILSLRSMNTSLTLLMVGQIEVKT